MLVSDILPITGVSARVADCGVGQEVTLFGLTLINSAAVTRTVTVSIFRQSTGATKSMPVEIVSKGKTSLAEKVIALQPGDHLDMVADGVGVNLLWSMDIDTGINPVASGFTPRGTHSMVAAYSANDVVFKAGSSFVALRNNTGKDPETEAADWMRLVDGSGALVIADTVIDGAPTNLNTLNKIAAAIGNDPDFAITLANALALKANTAALASVAFSGDYADLDGIKKLAVRRLFSNRELI